MAKLVVDFTNETDVQFDVAPLQQHLERILDRLDDKRELAIELLIADTEKVQQLNKKYLEHDYPTDVLSFPAPKEVGEKDEAKPLGSIILCEPIARNQANEAGISFEEELKVLAGHSLLHLLGFHHR